MAVLAQHFMKLWVQAPAPLKLSMAVHPGNLSTQQVRAEDQKFKFILSFLLNLRPA